MSWCASGLPGVEYVSESVPPSASAPVWKAGFFVV